MKRMRLFTAFISFLALVVMCAAAYSDDFVLGAYSELRSHNIGSSNFSAGLAQLLKQAGFNSAKGIAVYDSDQQKVELLAHVLDADSLDLILEDHIFIPGEQYGYSALSTGVYMKFEAEYCSQDSVNYGDENDDRFFYKSVNRVGTNIPYNSFSNFSYWHIPSDSTGYAYKDLLYRWSSNEGTYTRIGPEFRFLSSKKFGGNLLVPDNNCLYVKFVFKSTDFAGFADTDTLATFTFSSYDDPSVVVFDDEDYPNLRYIPDAEEPEKKVVFFQYGTDDTFITEKSLTKAEYMSLPSANNQFDPSIKSITFRFPIEVPGTPNPNYSLVGQEIVKSTGWYWQLKNLNPLMWWHGRGHLMLDYVEYADEIFHINRLVPAERNRIKDIEVTSRLVN